MSRENVSKIFAILIFACGLTLLSAGCSVLSQSSAPIAQRPDLYSAPIVTGKLESDDLKEASGIAESKCQPGVFWTHNDSEDEPVIYAIDSKGADLGGWRVEGAVNQDWEDIAAFKDKGGKCYVVIGDIGNNELDRERLDIYQVEEPKVGVPPSGGAKKEQNRIDAVQKLSFRYPDGRHNAEALLVHPETGIITVLTKAENGPSGVFRVAPTFGSENLIAERVADVAVPAIPNGVITGGDISADGRRVILCDYFAGYEFTLPVGAEDFDQIWKQKPVRVDLGKREIGEGVAYADDGKYIISISEKRHTPVNIVRRLE